MMYIHETCFCVIVFFSSVCQDPARWDTVSRLSVGVIGFKVGSVVLLIKWGLRNRHMGLSQVQVRGQFKEA